MTFQSMDASSIRFLESLRQMETRLGRAQREAATGKRILSPSDAPDSISTLLEARAGLARLEQIQTNLGRIKSETDGAEQALQNAVRLFDEVRTLGMSGANGVQTALTREGIAGQVGSILERLVGLANTNVGGRYVFAGDNDTNLAYDPADLAQSPPWGAYLGAASTRHAQHPTGVLFRVGMSAEEIFDHPDPGKSVFAGIENLRQALLANDEDAMRAALAPLADLAAHLNAALSFHGNAQSQIAEALDTGAKLNLRLHAEISGMEDADMTSAILESQQLMYQREAALRIRGTMPRQSLFDYLG
jgi:flagellar hook-associated protein 3 FlgL